MPTPFSMDDADFDAPRLGRRRSAPKSLPFPRPRPRNYQQPHPRDRDVAMKRDRKRHGDDRRDRGRQDRGPRGPAKNRSTSPPVSRRAPPAFRDRDYLDNERPTDRLEREDRHHRGRSRDRERSRERPRGAKDDEIRRDKAPPPPPPPPPHRPRPHPQPYPHRDLRDSSRSPRPSSRSSFSRTHSPYPPPGRPYPAPSEAGSFSSPGKRRRSLSPAAYPPPDRNKRSRRERSRQRSPRGDRGPRKKGKRRGDKRAEARGEPSSGANSVEVNMSRRGGFRGNFDAHAPPAYPSKQFNDARYNQSPPHVTPGSSYHGSPNAQSPYHGGNRGSWNGQPQYSPHQSNSGPPTGPQSQFHQSHSPPYPPTGPQQSFASGRGFSRGAFRGGNLNSQRGGPRVGSFKNALNPPTGPAASRHQFHSGENTPHQSSPQYTASNHSDTLALKEDVGDENAARPSKNLQVEDETPEKKDDDQMPPPTRAPPTGPSAGKFSFAFKATSKTPVAAPKPEISQKFSAAPPRRDPLPVDDRSNRDRDLPRGTPTEPASARARSDYHHNRQQQHAPEPPRTRKVKKIQRNLKPKPKLPDDLASSQSVFFRKPGNESVVGSGTYGKVFKGLNVYTKKLVALKKIRMEGERDGFPVTAVREIKLLQSLKHDNIVNLQEVMVEKNDCYMVFEYLSHDLTGLLNHPTYKLDAAQKKHLGKQLFEGLDYLHSRGVLHRDIKAANILVSSDGVLKLADFGLARFYAKRHQLDYTNRVITIWYRSPELLLGETRYGMAVDIWSAACVLVEIFTRHAIFPGDGTEINQLDKIYAVLGTPNKVDWPDLVKMEWFELLRPTHRRPNVFADKYKERLPAAAFELLASMFQYDPTKRPSAAEVLGHGYFTTEQPPPRQAIELAGLKGDWHEFESKALRREKEKQERHEREARRAAAARESSQKEREKKRPSSSHDSRDSKRAHIEARPA